MFEFKVDDKKVNIFCSKNSIENIPVIILNTFSNEGNEVWKECKKINSNDFILVAISNINWDDEMTPWECDSLFKDDKPCKGLADEYLKQLIDKIIPKAKEYIENNLNKKITYFSIAGYSLGGLFALYSGYKTSLFKKIISCSGSLWYPGMLKFVEDNTLNENVDKIYFSLGNKEKNSKNAILKTVEDRTIKIENILSKRVNTIFEFNEGNHFVDANLRLAKGIKLILE